MVLATKVSFRAIPVVDGGGDEPPSHSSERILCYVSTITSVGSVVLSQLVARYHRVNGWVYLDERAAFII